MEECSMKAKKFLALVLALAMSLTLFGCGSGSSGGSQTSNSGSASTDSGSSGTHEAITIKLQGAFAEGTAHYFYLDQFIETVSELSEGSVTVVWGAGPEAIPTDQLAEAMQNGIVEMVFSPTAYLETVSPVLGAVKISDGQEMRQNGGVDYINEIVERDLKCHYLGRTNLNAPMALLSYVEITSLDDFKGVVFRGTAAQRSLLEALGAEVMTMGWADVYSAVDKNVVSGVGGTYQDFVDNDLGGHVKYLISPGFYGSDSSLYVADAVWNKLDDVQKNALTQATIDWENYSVTYNQETNEKFIQQLVDAGTTVIDLETLGLADQFTQTAYDACWASVEAKAPEDAAGLAPFMGK
jgi:TRAP-type C4-dicarboxylate transport system substrate-binding protein